MLVKSIKQTMVIFVGVIFLTSGLAYAIPQGEGPDSACPISGAGPCGHDHGKGFGKDKEKRHEDIFQDLNLTDEQKKALDANKEKNRTEGKELFGQMKEKRDAMRLELEKDTLDMAKIDQLNNEVKALDAKMNDHRLKSILEVRSILTPEQFKKFSAKMEEKRGKFKGKHGKKDDTKK